MIPLQTYRIVKAIDAPIPKKTPTPRCGLTDLHRNILGALVQSGRPLTTIAIAQCLQQLDYLAVGRYLRLLINHGLVARRIDGTYQAIPKEPK